MLAKKLHGQLQERQAAELAGDVHLRFLELTVIFVTFSPLNCGSLKLLGDYLLAVSLFNPHLA